MGAQSVRLIVFLPLLLRRYDESEVAAWLLFGSILFVGTMLAEQAALVGARLIAMAMGGATDLSPTRVGEAPRGGDAPQWPLVGRVFGAMGALNLALALAAVGVAIPLGIASLDTDAVGGGAVVWTSFLVMLAGETGRQLTLPHFVLLRGTGRVALVNRWSAVIAIGSALAGAGAVVVGADLVALAVVVQTANLLGAGCVVAVARRVEPRVREFRWFAWDREVLRWSAGPYLRSILQSLANRGALKLGTIVYARHGSPAEVAGFLLAVRLFETVAQVALAPLSSHVPHLVRLHARGDAAGLRARVGRQFRLSQGLQAVGVLAVVLFGGLALEAVGSAVELPRVAVLCLLGAAFALVAFIRQSLVVSLVGNHVVAVERMSIALALSAAICPWAARTAGDLGVVLAVFAPQIVLVHGLPFTLGARLVGLPPAPFFRRAVMPAWILLAIGLAVAAPAHRALGTFVVPLFARGP
jgi:hypothetical protein